MYKQYINRFKNQVTMLFIALCLVSLFSLTGCSGAGNCNTNSENNIIKEYSLIINPSSPVPLVNGTSTPFYVYVTNIGNGDANDLIWSIKNPSSDSNTNQSLIQRTLTNLKSYFEHEKSQVTALNNSFIILDSSGASTIKAGQTNRILLQALGSTAQVSSALLQAKNSKNNTTESMVISSPISSYFYLSTDTKDLADILTISPLENINVGSGANGYSFSIINNGLDAVNWDSSTLFPDLPSGVTFQPGNCANPIPPSGSCQGYLSFANNIAIDSEIVLSPHGYIVGSDGSISYLPEQNGSNSIFINSTKLGNATAIPPGNLIVNDQTQTTTSGIGYILNNGNAPIVINSIQPTSSVIEISSDQCTNKTVAPNEFCTYSADPVYTSITSPGSTTISISYNNTKQDMAINTQASWQYVYVPQVRPSINISTSSQGVVTLSKDNPEVIINITNNGNVNLMNLSTLNISPTNDHLFLTAINCSSTLMVGQSCNYKVTYSPQAPSETKAVLIGNISASYLNEKGKSEVFNSTSSVAVNLSSTFAGNLVAPSNIPYITNSTPINLEFKNNGNYLLSLNNDLSITGRNLTIINNTCRKDMIISPGGTCNVQVSLIDSITGDAGIGTFNINYNNYNGQTSENLIGNINWNIDFQPNLAISFSNQNLSVIVGGSVTTQLTIYNTGNTTMNNIVFPTLPTNFVYSPASNNTCSTNGSQSLLRNDSCLINIIYSPNSPSMSSIISLGNFLAAYSGGTYQSSNQQISAEAISRSALTMSNNAVSFNTDWTQPFTQTSVITLKNTGSSEISAINFSSLPNWATENSDCTSGLAIEATCSVNITISPTTTGSNNNALIIEYTDAAGVQSTSLDISYNIITKPIIAPIVSISPNSLGIKTISINETSTIIMTLTNSSSSSQGAGDTTIRVNTNDLLPANTANFTFEIDNAGLSTTACEIDNNQNISLSSGSSCEYNLKINGISVIGATPINKDINYQYYSYSDVSTIPTYITSSTPISYSGSVQVIAAQPNLVINTLQLTQFATAEIGGTYNQTFEIKNIGFAAVAGSLQFYGPNGFSIPTLNTCDNLASQGTCTVTLVYQPTAAATGELNTAYISYEGLGSITHDSSFSSIYYKAVAPSTPNINVTSTVENCAVGTGASNSICLVNSGTQAQTLRVKLNFTNISNTVIASNFNVNTSQLSTAYQAVNGCTNMTLGENESCSVTLTISNVNDDTSNYNLISNIATYSYNYGSQNQISVVGQQINSGLYIDVTVPSISITSGALIIPPNSSEFATVTLSNWYQTARSVPITFSVVEPDNITTVATISVSNCSSITLNTGATGGSCSARINVSSTTTAKTAYSLQATVRSGSNTWASTAPFDVGGWWSMSGTALSDSIYGLSANNTYLYAGYASITYFSYTALPMTGNWSRTASDSRLSTASLLTVNNHIYQGRYYGIGVYMTTLSGNGTDYTGNFQQVGTDPSILTASSAVYGLTSDGVSIFMGTDDSNYICSIPEGSSNSVNWDCSNNSSGKTYSLLSSGGILYQGRNNGTVWQYSNNQWSQLGTKISVSATNITGLSTDGNYIYAAGPNAQLCYISNAASSSTNWTCSSGKYFIRMLYQNGIMYYSSTTVYRYSGTDGSLYYHPQF